MQIVLKQTVIKIAKYLSVDVAVRYDDEDMAYDAPMREGEIWKATIDLDTKKILNWPEGKSLSFEDMKICDQGIYILLDENKEEMSPYLQNASHRNKHTPLQWRTLPNQLRHGDG